VQSKEISDNPVTIAGTGKIIYRPPRRTYEAAFPAPETADLSKAVHQQLNMYAIAAGAAGVGLVGLAPPVEARIVLRLSPAEIVTVVTSRLRSKSHG
jgi:hypothetical protein